MNNSSDIHSLVCFFPQRKELLSTFTYLYNRICLFTAFEKKNKNSVGNLWNTFFYCKSNARVSQDLFSEKKKMKTHSHRNALNKSKSE